jgi:hypothetical protein
VVIIQFRGLHSSFFFFLSECILFHSWIIRGKKLIKMANWVNMIVEIMYLWRAEPCRWYVLHKHWNIYFCEKCRIRGPYNLKTNTEYKINYSLACLNTVLSSYVIKWSCILNKQSNDTCIYSGWHLKTILWEIQKFEEGSIQWYSFDLNLIRRQKWVCSCAFLF